MLGGCTAVIKERGRLGDDPSSESTRMERCEVSVYRGLELICCRLYPSCCSPLLAGTSSNDMEQS